MKWIVSILLVLLLFSEVSFSQKGITEVAVIAPSVSTSMKAREVRHKMKWQEVAPKDADYILVVVRSGLSYPLQMSYDSYGELKDDAENQLNISGSNYHIYLFYLEKDLSVTVVDHKYYEAED